MPIHSGMHRSWQLSCSVSITMDASIPWMSFGFSGWVLSLDTAGAFRRPAFQRLVLFLSLLELLVVLIQPS